MGFQPGQDQTPVHPAMTNHVLPEALFQRVDQLLMLGRLHSSLSFNLLSWPTSHFVQGGAAGSTTIVVEAR
jgi:hypothetical protein